MLKPSLRYCLIARSSSGAQIMTWSMRVNMCEPLLRLVSDILDELRVHRGLFRDERAHFLERHADGVEALTVQPLFHVRQLHDADQLARELVHDRLRCLAR